MTRLIAVLSIAVLSVPGLFGGGEAGEKAAAGVSYSQEIQPLLQRSCQGCHQPSSRQGALDVTNFESLRTGGQHGEAFVAGAPDRSLLLAHLTGDREPRMPLGQPPLDPSDIELFRAWIASGARDDSSEMATRLAGGKPPVYRQPPVITALAYSPDGGTLAVSGYREVLLHRDSDSEPDARLVGTADRIQSLGFTADGKTLMVAGGRPASFGEVQFWDVESGQLRRAVRSCHDTLFGASLSPDGTRVAFGCADHTVRIMEVATGKELLKMRHHENWVLGTVFGVDGKRVISVGRDRAAKLVDATSGAFIENVNLLKGELTAIARHPSRETVAIGGEDRTPLLYRVDKAAKMLIADNTNLLHELEKQDGEIFDLAFSPDGRTLAVSGASSRVPLYEVESGAASGVCDAGHQGVYAVAFHPDGARLAMGGFDGTVRICELDSGRTVSEFIPVPIRETLVSSR
jgi:WD40 repeat protein